MCSDGHNTPAREAARQRKAYEDFDEGDIYRGDISTSSSNAMWGWIAGGIVLALLLVFVFGGSK